MCESYTLIIITGLLFFAIGIPIYCICFTCNYTQEEIKIINEI